MKLYLATLLFAVLPLVLSVIGGFSKRNLLKSDGFFVLSALPFFGLFMAAYYRTKWVNAELGVDELSWLSGFFVFLEILAVAVIAVGTLVFICVYVQATIEKRQRRTSKIHLFRHS